jgi:hypothetical protein
MWLNRRSSENEAVRIRFGGSLRGCGGRRSISTPFYRGWRILRATVLNSLTSKSGQRTYDHAITDSVESYCSEPRLAFNRTVVLRYEISLEQKLYAPTTINLRLAAVRRVAYEAAGSGLPSPELAAGSRQLKGVRRIGVRVGELVTAEQGKRPLAGADRRSRLVTAFRFANSFSISLLFVTSPMRVYLTAQRLMDIS